MKVADFKASSFHFISDLLIESPSSYNQKLGKFLIHVVKFSVCSWVCNRELCLWQSNPFRANHLEVLNNFLSQRAGNFHSGGKHCRDVSQTVYSESNLSHLIIGISVHGCANQAYVSIFFL